MGNRTIIKYFLSIMGASLLFFGIASAGSFAVDTFAFGKRFGEHTYAGPFNLSKQTDQEAEIKLTSDLLGMQDKLQADLVYQDATFSLPADLIEYHAAATVERAQSESENPLVATVSEDGLQTVLQQNLPMLTFSDSEVASIASGISEKLQTGIMPQSIAVTDYLESGQPTTEIASASVVIDGLTHPMLELIKELDGFQLKPEAPFSLLAFMEESQPGLLNAEEQTLLASALYSAALQTNFWVEDRTIRRSLMKNVQPGFEAAINPQLGLDFVLTNPNDTSYTVRADWDSGSLNVAFEGLPLRYTYEPYIAETNHFKPKTVVQYSEDLSRGQVNITEDGADGFEVIVQRKITEDGTLITTESVSDDFYPPVSRVEQHSLTEPDAPTGNGNPSSDGVTDGSTGNQDSSSGNSTGGKPDPGTNGGASNGNKPSGTDKPSNNPDGPAGSDSEKPSTKPEKKPVYDKGGNLVE